MNIYIYICIYIYIYIFDFADFGPFVSLNGTKSTTRKQDAADFRGQS